MITAAASRHAATARTLRHTPLRCAADRWAALVAGGAAARVSDPEFVDECRWQYVANGWCHVPMFLPRATCDELRAEAVGLLESEHAFASSDEHTVYQEEADPRLPPDHARNRLMQSKKRIVDYARIPPQSALRALYTAPQLRGFVQAVVGVPSLHLSACPFNAAMVRPHSAPSFRRACSRRACGSRQYNGYYDTDGLGWHFDRSEFGVNLVLQAASSLPPPYLLLLATTPLSTKAHLDGSRPDRTPSLRPFTAPLSQPTAATGAHLGRRLRLPSPHAQRGGPLVLRRRQCRAARSGGAAGRRGERGECAGAGDGGGGGLARLLRGATLPAPRLARARPQAPHQRDPHLREGARPARQPLCVAARSRTLARGRSLRVLTLAAPPLGRFAREVLWTNGGGTAGASAGGRARR